MDQRALKKKHTTVMLLPGHVALDECDPERTKSFEKRNIIENEKMSLLNVELANVS